MPKEFDYEGLCRVLNRVIKQKDFIINSVKAITSHVGGVNLENKATLAKDIFKAGPFSALSSILTLNELTTIASLGLNLSKLDPTKLVLNEDLSNLIINNGQDLGEIIAYIFATSTDAPENFNIAKSSHDLKIIFANLGDFIKTTKERLVKQEIINLNLQEELPSDQIDELIAKKIDLKTPEDLIHDIGLMLKEDMAKASDQNSFEKQNNLFNKLDKIIEQVAIAALNYTEHFDKLVAGFVTNADKIKTEAIIAPINDLFEKLDVAKENHSKEEGLIDLGQKFKQYKHKHLIESFDEKIFKNRDLSIDLTNFTHNLDEYLFEDFNFSETLWGKQSARNSKFIKSNFYLCEFTQEMDFGGSIIDAETLKSMLPSLRVAKEKGIKVKMNAKFIGNFQDFDISGLDFEGSNWLEATTSNMNVKGTLLSGSMISEENIKTLRNYDNAIAESLYTQDINSELKNRILEKDKELVGGISKQKIELERKFKQKIASKFDLQTPKELEQSYYLWLEIAKRLEQDLNEKFKTNEDRYIYLNLLNQDSNLEEFTNSLIQPSLNDQGVIIPQIVEKGWIYNSSKDISFKEYEALDSKKNVVFRLNKDNLNYGLEKSIKEIREEIVSSKEFKEQKVQNVSQEMAKMLLSNAHKKNQEHIDALAQAVYPEISQLSFEELEKTAVEIKENPLLDQIKKQNSVSKLPTDPQAVKFNKHEVELRKDLRKLAQDLASNINSSLKIKDAKYKTDKLEEELYKSLKDLGPEDLKVYKKLMNEKTQILISEVLTGSFARLEIIKPKGKVEIQELSDQFITEIGKNFINIKENNKLGFNKLKQDLKKGKKEVITQDEIKSLQSLIKIVAKLDFTHFPNSKYKFLKSNVSKLPRIIYILCKNFGSIRQTLGFVSRFTQEVGMGTKAVQAPQMTAHYIDLLDRLFLDSDFASSLYVKNKNGKKIPSENICTLASKINILGFYLKKEDVRNLLEAVGSGLDLLKDQPKKILEMKEILKTGDSKKIASFLKTVKEDIKMSDAQFQEFAASLKSALGIGSRITTNIIINAGNDINFAVPMARAEALIQASTEKRQGDQIFDFDKKYNQTHVKMEDSIFNNGNKRAGLNNIKITAPEYVNCVFNNISHIDSKIIRPTYRSCIIKNVSFDNNGFEPDKSWMDKFKYALPQTSFENSTLEDVSARNCYMAGINWEGVKIKGSFDISHSSMTKKELENLERICNENNAALIGADKVNIVEAKQELEPKKSLKSIAIDALDPFEVIKTLGKYINDAGIYFIQGDKKVKKNDAPKPVKSESKGKNIS